MLVLVPRQPEELEQAARRLQEGQKVGVSFVTEAGHKFIKDMGAERREVVEERPEAAVGKELIITIRADEELGGRFLCTLRALEIGERVLVEAFHFEGNRLTVVEQLRKFD